MTMLMKPGCETVSLEQDDQGYRTVKAKYLIRTDDGESVFRVLNHPDLPQPGSIWQTAEGGSPDVDPDIFCTAETSVQLFKEKDYQWYEVTRTFSNKPGPDHCVLEDASDPLQRPSKVSGRFTKFTEEAAYDKDYLPILSSSGELIRGPAVEFDESRFSVRVEQNVYPLRLPVLYAHKDVVNDAALWGFPARSVKVSAITFDRKFYGPPIQTGSGTSTGTQTTCQIYYVRVVEVDVWLRRDPADPTNPLAVVSGHDRLIPDEGKKVLRGRWETRKGNANYGRWVLAKEYNFVGGIIQPRPELGETTAFHPREEELVEYTDFKGNTTRAQLNGQALPAGCEVANPLPPFGYEIISTGPQARILVRRYPQADLTAPAPNGLALPAVIEL